MEITWIVSVDTRFFDDGCDGSQFKGLGDRTRAEGGGNDISDEWRDDREAALNEFGWHRLQSKDGGGVFYPRHEGC